MYEDRTVRPFATPAGTWKYAMTSQAAAMSGLKQETIAIAAVGLTILGTTLYTTSRIEARIDHHQAET